MLDRQTIEIVKATAPVLKEHGVTITKHFYQRMFEQNPEVRHFFNHTNQKRGRQPEALANAVYAAALHIDRLEAILPAIQPALHKHKSLNIRPEHYPIVGENLLGAIQDVLGEAATPDIIDAWAKAYGVIADVFISLEKQMYDDAPWVGFKSFVIEEIIEDTLEVKRFRLVAKDKVVGTAIPGQYVSVQARIAGEDIVHHRQYSVIDTTEDGYWIAPKREGLVSNWLHEQTVGTEIPVSAPAGEFTLEASNRPLTLIAGGIGITPLFNMAKTALGQGRSVTLLHAVRSMDLRPLGDELDELVDQGLHLITHVDGESGCMSATQLEALDVEGHDVYTCGPNAMMETIVRVIPQARYEFFGPSATLSLT
ncbi:globin domain-containing protein [Exiguobacterium aestuarii]|uniref:nitric oxide dioxygenase n=1 Tax=Exiguobacterium aestuarii TaxID=273527 RepID=A0ABW2PNG2_9BACL|nr:MULTISPECIES: globin domain-containing protein [Exiguobacterium]MCT4784854.1 globin domain-containing protein [Exiguobacterium aestuarii]